MHLHRTGDFARAARISRGISSVIGEDGADHLRQGSRAADGQGVRVGPTGSDSGTSGGENRGGENRGGENRGELRAGQPLAQRGLRRVETSESEIRMEDRHHGTRLQFGAGGGYWG